MTIFTEIYKKRGTLHAFGCGVLIVFGLIAFNQMIRSYTLAGITGMTQIFWPYSIRQEPRDMVSIKTFSVSPRIDSTISSFIATPNPKPAIFSFVDIFQESGNERFTMTDINSDRHIASLSCDETLLKKHVYHPERLLVKSACVSVTGTIVDATHGKHRDGVRHEADGDCHGWLKLDSGQEQFLNAGNMSAENGNLVFEVVCLFRVSQPDAVAACKGYKSHVKLVPVGSHVKMTGSWVQDTNHAKWLELHPVTSIEVLPPGEVRANR